MNPNDQKSDMAKILLFIFAVITVILTNSNGYLSGDSRSKSDSYQASLFSID